jgi:hypothetical protein
MLLLLEICRVSGHKLPKTRKGGIAPPIRQVSPNKRRENGYFKHNNRIRENAKRRRSGAKFSLAALSGSGTL